jgi:hypothetical protein
MSGGGEMTPTDEQGEVEVTVLGEGESIQKLGLTESRIGAIASLLSIPRDARRIRYGLECPEDDIRFLASRLGISRADIKRSLSDRRVLNRVIERATQAAVLLAPDMVYEAHEIAKSVDSKPRDKLVAIRLMLEIAKLIRGEKGTQVNVQTNVAVDVHANGNSAVDGGISEDALIRAQLEELKASGFLERFLALPSGSTETPPGV